MDYESRIMDYGLHSVCETGMANTLLISHNSSLITHNSSLSNELIIK
jgi:hypothetical protein